MKIVIRNTSGLTCEFRYRKLARSVTEIELTSSNRTSIRLEYQATATIQAGRAAAVLIDLNGNSKPVDKVES